MQNKSDKQDGQAKIFHKETNRVTKHLQAFRESAHFQQLSGKKPANRKPGWINLKEK